MNEQRIKKKKTHVVLIVIAILVSLIGTRLFLDHFERYEKTTDQGWTLEALLNPWLAAEKYLEKLDHRLTYIKHIERLHPLQEKQTPNETLLITDIDLILTEAWSQSLLNWVEKGGQLIIGLPNSTANSTHPILEHLGVRLENNQFDTNQEGIKDFTNLSAQYHSRDKSQEKMDGRFYTFDEWASKNHSNLWNEIRGQVLTTIEFEDAPLVEVFFRQEIQLNHEWLSLEEKEIFAFEGSRPHSWAWSTAKGVNFLKFKEGEGTITLLVDPTIWYSGRINQYDHAWLLWKLAKGGSVSLLHDINMPPFYTVIWRSAPEAVIAFILWLVGWLLYRGRRFGTIHELSFTKRRSIIEHVRAGSGYLWYNKKPGTLITPLQDAINKRCQQLCPDWHHLSREQQLRWLAQHCRHSSDTSSPLSEKQLAEALAKNFIGSESAFTDRVRTLQKIRETVL